MALHISTLGEEVVTHGKRRTRKETRFASIASPRLFSVCRAKLKYDSGGGSIKYQDDGGL